MNLRARYSTSKCPNCGKHSISYWKKMKLIGHRHTHTCSECGGVIKLPLWHTLLYLVEMGLMFFSMVKFNLNSWQAAILTLVVVMFIVFIQLPLVHIEG